MKLSARALFEPLVGLLVLALVLNVTLAALRTSGAWRARTAPRPARVSPYAALDQVLGARRPETSAAVRNPFSFGGPTATAAVTPRPHRPIPPPPPPLPILTSIVWDADPRATIRFNGRDYSVRPSGLFDDFRVVSITRDQVVLDRAGESLVLRLLPVDR